jgi:replication factor A1
MQLLGSHGTPEWVKVPATLFSVRADPMTYPACMNDFNGRKCQKKMSDNSDGSFYCERCAVSGQPTWRYLLNMSIMDFEGQLSNLSSFGEAGEAVMNGMTADVAHLVCSSFLRCIDFSHFVSSILTQAVSSS